MKRLRTHYADGSTCGDHVRGSVTDDDNTRSAGRRITISATGNTITKTTTSAPTSGIYDRIYGVTALMDGAVGSATRTTTTATAIPGSTATATYKSTDTGICTGEQTPNCGIGFTCTATSSITACRINTHRPTSTAATAKLEDRSITTARSSCESLTGNPISPWSECPLSVALRKPATSASAICSTYCGPPSCTSTRCRECRKYRVAPITPVTRGWEWSSEARTSSPYGDCIGLGSDDESGIVERTSGPTTRAIVTTTFAASTSSCDH